MLVSGTKSEQGAIRRGLTLFTLILAATRNPFPCMAFDLCPEPSPLRRDSAIRGRDVPYDSKTFLHRLSYRYRPAADLAWRTHPQGLRTSAGSTTSSEFYYTSELRKSWDLDGPLTVTFRHVEDEDFDGTYSRTLTGLGWQGDAWAANMLGTVDAHKENIDVQIECAYRYSPTRRARLAIVAVDYPFNRKSELARYDAQPYTLFGEVFWNRPRDLQWHAWVSRNTETTLRFLDNRAAFSCDEWEAQARCTWSVADHWRIDAHGAVLQGDRALVEEAEMSSSRSALRRRHARGTLILHRQLDPRLAVQAGAHILQLTEDVERTVDGTPDLSSNRRRERMLYAGLEWSVRRRILFWPGVYLARVDNSDDTDPDEPIDNRGFRGKLSLPLEIRIGEEATLTLQPGFRLDDTVFGGMNVSLLVPF